MVHSVGDMSADQRSAIESLLGRHLRYEEKLSIRPVTVVKEAPPLSRRLEIAQELRAYFTRIDAQRAEVSEEELDAAIDEALRSVRASYKPAR